MSNIVIE